MNTKTNTMEHEATPIEKEEIPNLSLTKEDVLEKNPYKKRLRDIYLTKAQRLGNVYKGKVKMFFKTVEGNIYAVNTTIWAANEKYISLKGGIHVPTNSVVGVEF